MSDELLDRTEQTKQAILQQARLENVNAVIKPKSSAQIKQIGLCSGLENKPEIFELLNNMKRGIQTVGEFSLDGLPLIESKAKISLRILSVTEALRIKKEMRESGLIPNMLEAEYELLKIAKTISLASTNLPTNCAIKQQPILSENDVLNMLPETYLLALGYKYAEFIQQNSPDLETYTVDQIQQVIEEIKEALLSDPKDVSKNLIAIFTALDLNATHGVIIESVTSLMKITSQMDKLRTGV